MKLFRAQQPFPARPLILLLFSILVFLPAKTFASASVKERLQSLPTLTDGQIDLSDTLLQVSKDWDANFDPAPYLATIDRLTRDVKAKIAANPDPAGTVKALRESIHRNLGYDFTDKTDAQGLPLDTEELFLHGLLKTKRGYCMTLSLIYLIVGERLNLPLYGVALPNHFFVRYESPTYRVNVETTQQGESMPDESYRQRFGITPDAVFFMKNLGKKQTLGAYFSNIGITYYKQDKPGQAVFYLQLAVDINPASIEARNNLANIFAEQKQFDKALEHYLAALKTDPLNLATLFNLGTTYADAGKPEQAVEALLQVASLEPDNAATHKILAQLFFELGNPYGALLHLKKLTRLDPNNMQAHLAIADIYMKTGIPETALETLKKMQAVDPNQPGLKAMLAEANYRLGNFDQAVLQYRYLIEENPESLENYLQLGWTYYRQGKAKLAIAWTKQGLDRGQGNPKLTTLGQMNLGFYNIIERDFSQAEQWYGKALAAKNPATLAGMLQDLTEASEPFPDLPELEYYKGWLYFQSGQKEKATPHLKNYLRRAPTGAKAREATGILEGSVLEKTGDHQRAPGISRIAEGNGSKDPAALPDGMVEVPDGYFIMGSEIRGEDERPEHKVYLDAFYIDKHETTAKEFAEFLNTFGNVNKYYFDNKFGILEYDGRFSPKKDYENFPANNVSWFGADAYCKWKNKRLPTEAEWEKAARGTDGRIYPWDSNPPDQSRARYFQNWDNSKLNVMVPVDSMPDGQSLYGLFHMSGNIKEWVDDWFDSEYYKETEHKANPKSPPGGEFKSIRGGSWRDLRSFIYSSFRNNSLPETQLEDYGLRCAKSADESASPKRSIRFEK